MKLPDFIILLLIACVGQACAETFYVAKENSFSAVPEHIVRAIREEKKQVYDSELFTACKTLTGQSLAITKNSKAYVVSTNLCGCGSASCPIWLVDTSTETPKVLIADAGVVVMVSEHQTNSMPDIIITSTNAGTCSEHMWIFNGSQYAPSKWVACSEK